MFWDAWSKNRTFADTQDLDDIEPEMQATSFPMVINGVPARANGMLASSYPMKLEQSLHSVSSPTERYTTVLCGDASVVPAFAYGVGLHEYRQEGL
jgi:hypothetical protein